MLSLLKLVCQVCFPQTSQYCQLSDRALIFVAACFFSNIASVTTLQCSSSFLQMYFNLGSSYRSSSDNTHGLSPTSNYACYFPLMVVLYRLNVLCFWFCLSALETTYGLILILVGRNYLCWYISSILTDDLPTLEINQ